VNGRLATATGVYPVDIGISGGKIAAIGEWGDLPDAEQVTDTADRGVMPGGIDTHVHAGDPGDSIPRAPSWRPRSVA
jgi:dihydroorotase-like cyclic amidohydrolase